MNPYLLPPLLSLRAFEATARLASFKRAGEELHVTPTAISHQIRQLEERLGVRVLNRTPRAVTLTPEGLRLYRATALGFGEISRAVAELKQELEPPSLTLSATTSFLSHWLVPRLDALRRALPGIDLRLHASQEAVALAPGGADVAIRYGSGPFVGVEAVALLQEDVFIAVCSPALKLRNPRDLRRAKLIHVDGQTAPKPVPDWRRWCKSAGVEGIDTRAGLRFTDSMLAVQAAVAGLGVALISRVLVADALAAGVLVQPFEAALPGAAYHFVCAPGLQDRPDVAALRAWFGKALGGLADGPSSAK